jgi:hypothetical protein
MAEEIPSFCKGGLGEFHGFSFEALRYAPRAMLFSKRQG